MLYVLLPCAEDWLVPESFDCLDPLDLFMFCLSLLESHREVTIILAHAVLGHHASTIIIVVFDVLLVGVKRSRVYVMYLANFNQCTNLLLLSLDFRYELTITVEGQTEPMICFFVSRIYFD